MEQILMVDNVKGTPNFSVARAALISQSACCIPVKPTGAMVTDIFAGFPAVITAVLRFSIFPMTRWRKSMGAKSAPLAV